MIEIGTIKMTSPKGRPSRISVARFDAKTVDIIVSRSSEGEALIRLPVDIARQLSGMLTDACALTSGKR
jgi:hypothetical protein